MTPTQAKQALQRQLEAHGETVSLKRGNTTYSVKARVMDPRPSDLVGNIQLLGRKAIVSAEDVAAVSFPTPFLPKQDQLVWNGKTLKIMSINDSTRRIQGVLIAYELELSGA
jgi:hypothetical protein